MKKSVVLNKKMLIIIVMSFLMISATIYFGFAVFSETKKEFVSDGYILSEKSNKDSESYYFTKGDKYNPTYNDKITFSDKNGDQVSVKKDNFVHFMNNDIMAFAKGVFFDADQISDNNMVYYNISANNAMTKSGDSYAIKTSKDTTKMKNIIWKINDSKYIIISDKININLSKGNVKTVDGYIEVNFVDKGVVYLCHQQGTYQTVSSDASIELSNGLILNLNQKSLLKDNKEVLSLTQMIVDADDNVEVVEKVEEKEDEEDKKDTTNQGTTTQGGSAGGSTGGSGGTGSNGTQNDNQQNSDSNQTNKPTDETDDPNIPNDEVDTSKKFPVFELTELDTDVIKCAASIEITDDDDLLSSDTTIKIVEKGSNKTVYENKFTAGIYNINVLTENLKPDTEYTLIANANYTYLEETYNKDYISQVFTTDSLGISFSKNYIDTSEISILVQAQKYSSITDASLVLYDSDNNIVETQTIVMSAAKLDPQYNISFTGLEKNKKYTVKLENLIYDSSVVMDFNEVNKTFMTLKETPIVGEPIASVNVKGSSVLFTLKNQSSTESIIDPDKGVTKVEYEIYQVSQITDGKPNSAPVKIISKENTSSVDVMFDNEVLKRRVEYTYRVVTYFNDNEKLVELTSGFSAPFSLDSDQYPSVRYDIETNDDGEEIGIKHDSVSGTIVITDESRIIKKNTDIKWSMVANDGGKARSGKYHYDDSNELSFNVSAKNLKSNTSYFISISATIKVEGSSTMYEEVYIGGSRFTTTNPENILVSFEESEIPDYTQAFDYFLQLKDLLSDKSSEYEVSTLKNIELYLYPEDNLTGTYNKAQISNIYNVDDPEHYNYKNNSIKDDLYDKSMVITPQTFGLTSQDIVEDYYTLVVKNAIDYTDHQNKIGLVKSESDVVCQFKITPHGFIPSLPEKVDQALEVNAIINADAGQGSAYDGLVEKVSSLKPDTIVGYDILAKTFPSTGIPFAKSVTYQVYRINSYVTGKPKGDLVAEKTIPVTDKNAMVLPRWIIDMQNVENKDITRGEQYYFTYSVKMDLSTDGSGEYPVTYPTDAVGGKDVILSSKTENCPKETPVVRTSLYSTSSSNVSTWLYSVSDTDNAFSNNNTITNNRILITDGTTSRNYSWLEKNNDSGLYQFVSNQTSSTLFKVEKNYNLYNRDTGDAVTKETKYNLLTQPLFTNQLSTVKNITYSTQLTSSKLIISFTGTTNPIAAVKVTIKSDKKGTSPIVIDYLSIDTINQASISLMEIKEFLGSNITVDVSAYYPTTEAGSSVTGTSKPFILQKFKTSGVYSYVSGNTVSDRAINSLFYMDSQNYSEFQLNYIDSLRNNTTGNFKIAHIQNVDGLKSYDITAEPTDTYSFKADRQGLNTDSTGNMSVDTSQYYIFRKVAEQNLTTTQNTEKFTYIVPTISNMLLTPQLISSNMSFDYDGVDKSSINNNKIYLQFTDINGNDLKTTGFNQPFAIQISEDGYKGKIINNIDKNFLNFDLKEKTTYWFRLYVEFTDENNRIVEKSLVDSSQPNTDKPIYTFTTVSDIGLKTATTMSPYIFKNTSYEDKTMNFNFTVLFGSGYEMEFELVDTKTMKNIDLGKHSTKTSFITTGVNTHTLKVGRDDPDAIPGVKDLVYGNTYKLTAVAKTSNGTEVGKMSIPFTLKKLDNPVVYVTAKTDVDSSNTQKAKISYVVSVNDKATSITDKHYKLSVYSGERTKDKTAIKEQVVNFNNNTVAATSLTLTGLEKNQVYTVYIDANVDPEYDGVSSVFTYSSKTTTINEFGLSIGQTYTELIKENNKTLLQLSLYDAVGTTQIKRVNYTIINISTGSTVKSVTDEAVTLKTTNDISTLKLAQDISSLPGGRYGVVMQYLDDKGNVLATDSTLEFSISTSVVSKLLEFFGLD